MADIAQTIRALLAKANGTDNPHEAQAFYAKAHELMVKYNIAEDQLGTKPDLVRGHARWADDKWLWLVSNACAKLIGVNIFIDAWGGRYFAGRPMNVQMAEELFDHYVGQVNKYYKLALPAKLTKAERGVFRRNFKEGAAEVIWARVCEIVAHNTRALIVSPLQLEAEAAEMGVGPAQTKDVVIRHNSVGTHAGRVAGYMVELGKEVKAR